LEGAGFDDECEECAHHAQGDGDDEHGLGEGEVDDALAGVVIGGEAGAEELGHEADADGLGGLEAHDEQEEGREEQGSADACRERERRCCHDDGEHPPDGEHIFNKHGPMTTRCASGGNLDRLHILSPIVGRGRFWV
jgi:hypothetical protein